MYSSLPLPSTILILPLPSTVFMRGKGFLLHLIYFNNLWYGDVHILSELLRQIIPLLAACWSVVVVTIDQYDWMAIKQGHLKSSTMSKTVQKVNCCGGGC